MKKSEYGTLRDEMLRDRLVVGIRDAALSDKLQLDPTLTLESAKKAIRQKEAVREQRVELTSRTEHLVEDVTRRTASSPPHSRGQTSDHGPLQRLVSVNDVVITSTKGKISVQRRM